MTNRFILGLFVSLFLISLASAALTELNVHTLPVHDVSVYVLDPGPKYKSLNSFITRTGFDGLASKNITIDTTEFGIYVIVKKDGKTVFADRLENQNTQGVVDVYVLVNESDKFATPPASDSSGTTETVIDNNASSNESASGESSVEESNVEENSTESAVVPSSSSGVTGKAVSDSSADKTGNLVYIIAIAAVLGISLAGFLFMKQRQNNHPALRSDDRPPTVFMADKEIEEAERKIRYAQSQLALAREANAKRAEVQKREDLRKNFESSVKGNSGSLAASKPVASKPKLSGLISDAKSTNEKITNDRNSQNSQNSQDKNQGNSYNSSDKLDKL